MTITIALQLFFWSSSPLSPLPHPSRGNCCSRGRADDDPSPHASRRTDPTVSNNCGDGGKLETQLGFSTHRKKRMRQLKRQKKSGLASAGGASEDPFELFVNSTNIRYVCVLFI